MLKFSKNALDFFGTPPEKIFITFVSKWCDGTKIEVSNIADEKIQFSLIESNLNENIAVFVDKNYISKIDNWFLALVNNKWIFSHTENILSHCGCWKSFAFKSWDAKKDKIFLLKKKLRQSKNIHHED